jgi:fatty acid desaturase
MSNTEEQPRVYPISAILNLAIAGLQIAALLSLLWLSGRVEIGWLLILISVGYGIVMNSGYAMMHEAEHNILHPNRRINDAVGVTLGLFFPAPFHLLRQGHLGHHLRNRSDDEAFDFYFEGENPVWKFIQLYGILTGLFWITIVLSNFLALIIPNLLKPKFVAFDRPTAALLESLNPKFQLLVRWEALGVVMLHCFLIWIWHIPIINYFIVIAGFGVIWSALQYVHHFGTVRDVQKGALNLKTFTLLDIIWLNHNWHLNHHLNPTVPWIYLPFLENENGKKRGSLLIAYIRMWRGPRFTKERVQNRYAGKVIR